MTLEETEESVIVVAIILCSYFRGLVYLKNVSLWSVLCCISSSQCKPQGRTKSVRKQTINCILDSSTIDKLGEWCLERRVRPRIKPSQTHRVSMTTLGAAASHPPSTVTLTSQWKHKYLPHTYQSKREGQAGGKITA